MLIACLHQDLCTVRITKSIICQHTDEKLFFAVCLNCLCGLLVREGGTMLFFLLIDMCVQCPRTFDPSFAPAHHIIHNPLLADTLKSKLRSPRANV